MEFWNSVYKELFVSFGMQSRVVSLSKNCSLGIWMSLEQMLICENEIYSKRQNFSVESGMEGKPNFSPISRI